MSGPRASPARLVLRSLAASLWFAAIFFVALPWLVLEILEIGLIPPPGPGLWLGAAVIVAANLCVAALVWKFVREGRGTQAPLDPPRRLVLSGSYQRVRNPMYLLYTAVIVGEAIAWRSWALFVYALGFWLLAHLYVIKGEEPRLRRRFGADYEAYCRRVPRWLPRLGA